MPGERGKCPLAHPQLLEVRAFPLAVDLLRDFVDEATRKRHRHAGELRLTCMVTQEVTRVL